jgi:hypothetical protein
VAEGEETVTVTEEMVAEGTEADEPAAAAERRCSRSHSEDTFDATVSGSAISWTETRQGRDGNSISMEYKATVDGDSMQGTMGGGQFSRQFRAKRSN